MGWKDASLRNCTGIFEIDEIRQKRTVNKCSPYYNKKIMIKWIKKVFGITELIDEQKKTNELLGKILYENKRVANAVEAYNRAYHIPR